VRQVLPFNNFNPLIATLKPQNNGLNNSNTVTGTLAVDGWAVTFGTTRRGLGGAATRPGPSFLYQNVAHPSTARIRCGTIIVFGV